MMGGNNPKVGPTKLLSTFNNMYEKFYKIPSLETLIFAPIFSRAQGPLISIAYVNK